MSPQDEARLDRMLAGKMGLPAARWFANTMKKIAVRQRCRYASPKDKHMNENTRQIILAKLANLDKLRVKAALRIVTENIYAKLPSGDYGRGDVRRVIEGWLKCQECDGTGRQPASPYPCAFCTEPTVPGAAASYVGRDGMGHNHGD